MKAALYARLSISTEESVSIDRQLIAARKYAEARGFEVVLVATDDGVSATKNKPEDRDGWREILDSPETFDAVIVWKVDRLARRVLDFLHADEALRQRGAGLVAVEDPIDMTTPQGRAFAVMLAVFGEMEAAAIGARVKGSQAHVAHQGRHRGGSVPVWQTTTDNPTGPGRVVVNVPEKAKIVRRGVEAYLAGASINAVGRQWDTEGLLPARAGKTIKGRANPQRSTWDASSVRQILGNPALYGATPFRSVRPGEKNTATARAARNAKPVVRNPDGTVMIDESRALIDRQTFERIQERLDAQRSGGRPANPALLSGVLSCGTCGATLYINRKASDVPRYACGNRECSRRVSIRAAATEAVVLDRFRRSFGHLPVIAEVEIDLGPDPASLAALTARLAVVDEAIDADPSDEQALALLAERRDLRKSIAEEEARRPAREVSEIATGQTFGEAVDAAAARGALAEAASLIRRALGAVTVAPGPAGRAARPTAERLSYERDVTPDYLAGEFHDSPESVHVA